MSFKPHSHIPYGSDGSGYYADNTIGCYNVVQEATPMVLEALSKIPFTQNGKPFVICDYGTADGGISMFLIGKCIEWLKSKYGENQQVMVVYEDQPVNDFKSLFLRTQGLIPGPPPYTSKYKNVFITASGTSFFSQCLPSDTVHLMFSSTAMHWMSQSVSDFPDAIHHTQSKDEEALRKVKEQGAKDWETIMLARAAELVPGGRMMIVNFTVDEKGQHLGKTERTKENMYGNMTDIWKGMVKEGLITEEEFRRTNFQNVYRSVGECTAPLEDKDSSLYKAGLRLVNAETRVVDCPYHAKWMKEGQQGVTARGDAEAAKAHAKWFIPTTRTWSNSTFRSALNDTRSDQEADDLVDMMYNRYADRVAAAPADHGMDYVHMYLTIEKV